MARARKVRSDRAIEGRGRAVEQHALDANVIVKPFEMAKAGNGARDMPVKRRHAMARKVGVMRLAEDADLHESRKLRRSA